MRQEDSDHEVVRLCRIAAGAAGVLATVSLAGVLVGEATQGSDFMGSGAAELLGWASFISACALVVGVAGLGVGLAAVLSRPMARVWAVLLLATAVTAGAASTLALVVPTLAERAPDIAADPPGAVPATFVISGLLMGVTGIVLSLGIRRAVADVPRWASNLFVVGSVVAIVPLPSRYFLFAFGVAAVLAYLPGRSGAADHDDAGPHRAQRVRA